MTDENTKHDIPDGQAHDIREETELSVPDLPGKWEWSNANHITWNHKVNVFFGKDMERIGGWFGEIDNYLNSNGDEWWTLHVRPIIDNGTDTGRPRESPATAVEHPTLAAAIDAVPAHIETHYATTNDYHAGP